MAKHHCLGYPACVVLRFGTLYAHGRQASCRHFGGRFKAPFARVEACLDAVEPKVDGLERSVCGQRDRVGEGIKVSMGSMAKINDVFGLIRQS